MAHVGCIFNVQMVQSPYFPETAKVLWHLKDQQVYCSVSFHGLYIPTLLPASVGVVFNGGQKILQSSLLFKVPEKHSAVWISAYKHGFPSGMSYFTCGFEMASGVPLSPAVVFFVFVFFLSPPPKKNHVLIVLGLWLAKDGTTVQHHCDSLIFTVVKVI